MIRVLKIYIMIVFQLREKKFDIRNIFTTKVKKNSLKMENDIISKIISILEFY